MKENIKLVALDLDGTLLYRFSTISNYAIDVLKQLRNQGIIIVISTGRPYYAVNRIIPKECYDYISCMNGQEIIHNDSHEYLPFLNGHQVTYLFSLLDKYKVLAECNINNQSTYFCSKKYLKYNNLLSSILFIIHKIMRKPYYRQTYSSDYLNNDQYSFGKICFAGFKSDLKKIYQELDDSYSTYFVNNNWLEVMSKNISKGNTLEKIMSIENIKKEECCAFGDGENDITLLNSVKYSVAMKNGSKKLKKIAYDVCDKNSNDGCAKWLDSHLLKEKELGD